MTEHEWLACTDPVRLAEAAPAASARRDKLRSVGWCRLLPGGGDAGTPLGKYLDAVERHAESADDLSARNRARHWQALQAGRSRADDLDAGVRAARAILDIPPFGQVPRLLAAHAGVGAQALGRVQVPVALPRRGDAEWLAGVVRCIFGNPFRPVIPDPSWLTSTVTGVAGAIYESRAFHDLPILADALEEAGCGDEAVLSHCRGEGPHVRGCWVLDLCLGKC